MGLFKELGKSIGRAIINYDYSSAANRMNEVVEGKYKGLTNQFKTKCRQASSDQLRYKRDDLLMSEDSNAPELIEIIEDELNRRGEYY